MGLTPSSPREEYDLIMQMLDHETKNKREGDTWFVLRYKWWQHWMAWTTAPRYYLAFSVANPFSPDPRKVPPPDEIDISDLVLSKHTDVFSTVMSFVHRSSILTDEDLHLIPNMVENQSFKLVPAPVWKALCGWCVPLIFIF